MITHCIEQIYDLAYSLLLDVFIKSKEITSPDLNFPANILYLISCVHLHVFKLECYC